MTRPPIEPWRTSVSIATTLKSKYSKSQRPGYSDGFAVKPVFGPAFVQVARAQSDRVGQVVAKIVPALVPVELTRPADPAASMAMPRARNVNEAVAHDAH